MSNRALIIWGVLGVVALVAVALLVMLGMEDPLPPEAPVEIALPKVSDAGVLFAEKAPVSPAYDDAGTAQAVPPPAPEIETIAGEGTLSAEQLAPFTARVGGIVAQCSADLSARHKPPHHVTLSFEVRGDGENGHAVEPVLERSSVQDPYFEACVKDAPLDVQVPLPAVGAAKVRVRYP